MRRIARQGAIAEGTPSQEVPVAFAFYPPAEAFRWL